jgi:hypothetical protein
MNKSRGVADVFRKVRGKGNDIVVRRLLDLVYPLHGERSFGFDLFERVGRYRSIFGMNLADGDLDIEPLLKLILLRPDRTHLGQCVSFDHK